nr:keto-valine-ferredoxin oxidoreductase delta-subunit, VOR delta {N-terminal} [Thermococcus litoralis, DSM 5473, Peptide Partial, 15 aa] [Thermococcus litoralis]
MNQLFGEKLAKAEKM